MVITAHKLLSVHLLLGIVCSLMMSSNCYAVGDKTEGNAGNQVEDIHIQADRMHFDLQTDTSIYDGNVILTQGTMELFGDHIEIKQENNQIIKVVAKGSPAQYHQLDIDGGNILAQSKLIKYFATEDRLIMIDQARLAQNDHIIESKRIVYDTKTQTLLAGEKSDKPSTQERVKITLTPSNNEQ